MPGLSKWWRNQDDLSLGTEFDKAIAAVERGALTRLLPEVAAWYLLRGKNQKGLPVDPVARFHLGNGARVARINRHGDPSTNACETAFGVMANYEYKLEKIEQNHEQYANHGTVAAARGVVRLARSLDNRRKQTANVR